MSGPQDGEVYGRFAKAFAQVKAIAKGQRNQHHGYTYRGIEDLLNALHDVLAENELFYVPRCVGQEYEEWRTKNDGRLQVARLSYEFVFYAPDGSSLTVGPVVGQSADTDDKAPMQALSQSSKPALLQAFCVPTQDTADPDAKSPVSEDGGREQPSSSGLATDKRKGAIRSLLSKAPADRREKAEAWIAEKGGIDGLSKRDASAAIERLGDGS